VRYRSERHDREDIFAALKSAAEKSGSPLALAAACDRDRVLPLPPDRLSGLSELGQIAGCGMLIAFAMSITLLPALLWVLHPPGESGSMGFSFLAPAGQFTQRHRIPILVTTLIAVMPLSPHLDFVRFDFNPLSEACSSSGLTIDLVRDARH